MSLKKIRKTCDRCKKEVSTTKDINGNLEGFYNVGTIIWSKYARPGEFFVCTPCLHSDESFLKDNPYLRK